MAKILIVDDDTHINQMLTEALRQEGYAVQSAYSGTEALLCLQTAQPDLILLDVQMPDMDGFETMRELRRLRNGASVPVVFLSAADHEDTERTGMQLGAEDFIRKPFLPELLVHRVRRITELSAFRRSMCGGTNG